MTHSAQVRHALKRSRKRLEVTRQYKWEIHHSARVSCLEWCLEMITDLERKLEIEKAKAKK